VDQTNPAMPHDPEAAHPEAPRPKSADGAGGVSVRRTAPKRRRTGSDVIVAAACGGFVALMVGASYASVPLYTWFCRTTGFGGIPQIANAGPAAISDRHVTVRFDANVGPGLPWRFEPERNSIDVRIGEVVTVYYTATNMAESATAGQALYNVTPTTVGSYFTKINCFCFTEQRLAAGEKREMAVVFYVDPEMVKDSDQNDLNTITLSYTFYPLRPSRGGVADGTPSPRAGSGI
jgi:cytochrome c oxidase assembly protein subunit 11